MSEPDEKHEGLNGGKKCLICGYDKHTCKSCGLYIHEKTCKKNKGTCGDIFCLIPGKGKL
jgi:hypothetical protein